MEKQQQVEISDNHVTFNNYTNIFLMLLSMFAIFLSFKCNNGRFNSLDFIWAILFAPLYIPIKLGMHWNKCFS